MTPPEHYAKAEACLEQAESERSKGMTMTPGYWVAKAQVHATLATLPHSRVTVDVCR